MDIMTDANSRDGAEMLARVGILTSPHNLHEPADLTCVHKSQRRLHAPLHCSPAVSPLSALTSSMPPPPGISVPMPCVAALDALPLHVQHGVLTFKPDRD